MSGPVGSAFHRCRPLVAPLVAAWATLAGCSPPGPETVTVSAASDLRFAFQELGARFREETDLPVTFNFGSTGHLAQQIQQGAPVDVFAAADTEYVEGLVAQGHIIPGSVALYGIGYLVLWTREDGTMKAERLEDLLQPGVERVSIANPAHAPYGAAAAAALRSASLWDEVQGKLVLGESVNQAFQFAQTGNVDVGIVALSLAMVGEGGRYARIPEELHPPIHQAMGVVSSTRNEAGARAFVEFVNGPVGRPIMERYGFTLPETSP